MSSFAAVGKENDVLNNCALFVLAINENRAHRLEQQRLFFKLIYPRYSKLAARKTKLVETKQERVVSFLKKQQQQQQQ